jgi:DnaJ-class molecular chaperone
VTIGTGVPWCRDCAASTSGICARHGTEAYLRVSYTGEVGAARARLAETPHVCPVCAGRGFVGAGFYAAASGMGVTGSTASEQCRTCQGEGIVWRG